MNALLLLESTNAVALDLLVGLSVIYLICGLDDFFIDAIAFFLRLRPKHLRSKDMRRLHSLPEKRIAIMVPAWQEGEIIDRMLVGNMSHMDYSRYHFFIGIYPNDTLSVEKLREVNRKYPNVVPVINFKDGPSSKGQILNYVVDQILEYEKTHNLTFDAFHMQDAEDVIHPKVLKLVNHELESASFIQVPVYSLEVKKRQLVAGTYMDEFAESHTKDMLVRESLGAAVPSAGVGTTMSRSLVLRMREQNDGELYNEGSLTEDYELGLRAHALGFKPHFACAWYRHPETEKREYIATREFFPKRFSRSVRQKTRWTTGISLQGWTNLKWMGTLANRYFLARDRKGIVTNMAAMAGYPVAAFTGAYALTIDAGPINAIFLNPFMGTVLGVNVSLMVLRFTQRTRCTARVYGMSGAAPILLRWPVGIVVNALAAFHALKNHTVARFTKATLTWSKTEHELPAQFGASVTAAATGEGVA